MLKKIEQALCQPVFPLFLGRRSCPPEGKLLLGVRTGKTISEALREEPWLVSDWLRRRQSPELNLRIVADADKSDTNAFFQRDVPISFDQTHRKFGFRRVAEYAPCIVTNLNGLSAPAEPSTEHNPILELEEV